MGKEHDKRIEELRKLNEKKAEAKEQKKPKEEGSNDKIGDSDKIADLTDTLQRLQAEFENYKKRVERERQHFEKCAEERLVINLLPLLDSFELALKNTADKDKFVRGVEMIFAQFYSILRSEGLKPIDALGKKLDIYRHEALMKELSDKEEDIVIEELQKGYMFNDTVVRHSKVKVSKGKQDDHEKNPVKGDTGNR